jgi:hypothetical protein
MARAPGMRTEVTTLERTSPGTVATLIAMEQAWITARLRKRGYQTAPPVPEIYLRWLTYIVRPEIYRTLGRSSQQDDQIKSLEALAEEAKAEVKEAASAVDNLFDLPKSDTDTNASGTGITQAGPLGYSEQSPYAWQGIQMAAVRGGGGGTTGDVANPFGTTDDQSLDGDDFTDGEP